MNKPFGSAILDIACRLLIPFHLVFAIYVIIHGHYSPGGGFQGGAILAGAFIVLRLVRGSETGWGLTLGQMQWLASVGIFLFGLVGLVSLFRGEMFLDYSALPLSLSPEKVRAAGSLVIEVGVGLAVWGALLMIFHSLSGRGEHDEF